MIRRTWFLEELARPPQGTLDLASRRQFGVSAATLTDSMAGRVSALASLGYLELQLDAGQIYFGLANSDEGKQLRSNLEPEKSFFAFELARYFVNSNGYYGRVGLKFITFRPSALWVWRAGLQTGVTATPSSPWDVEFSVNSVVYFVHLSDVVLASLRTGRTFYFGAGEKQSLQVSGGFTFGKKTRFLEGESLLFSIGPSIGYSAPGMGEISLSIPFRVWIDNARFANGSIGYLSDFDPPAAQVNWTMFW